LEETKARRDLKDLSDFLDSRETRVLLDYPEGREWTVLLVRTLLRKHAVTLNLVTKERKVFKVQREPPVRREKVVQKDNPESAVLKETKVLLE